MIRLICLVFIFVFALSATMAAQASIDKKAMTEQVRAEFKHSWDGYRQYCWGHDDLKPISKTCRDWYGQTILMTPVDALDSLYLLGFKDEADKT
ncbi:MAG TPA: glycoside hydrolase family 47 protein, partial [Pyrinomonadaceae bacterium]